MSASLDWGIKVGLARYPKPASFTDLGQAAFEKNGNLPTFKEVFGRYFPASPLQQTQIRLELSQTKISATTFHPSCLFIESEANFRTLRKTDDVFGEYINQILTDDCFTLIENLTDTPGQGFRIRVWKRNGATPTSFGGTYATDNFLAITPLNDVTFKRPDGSPGNDTLIYIQTETTGSNSRTITDEIVQTLDGGKPATVTSKVFQGTVITGNNAKQLTQQDLIYSVSTHGTRPWDYNIARTVKTASVTADGTIGALATTAVTEEKYADFSISGAGGELGMKRLLSYNSSGQTTTYTYKSDPSDTTVNGRLESVIYPDGSWKSYEYSISTVSVITEYSSWQDVPITDINFSAHTTAARKTVTLVDDKSSLVETYIAGHLIAESKTTLTPGAENLITTLQWDGTGDGATLDASNSLTTTTAYFGDAATANPGRVKRIEHPDGTVTTYDYTATTVVETTPLTVTTTTYGPRQLPIGQETKTLAGVTIALWCTDGETTDNLGRPLKRVYPAVEGDYDESTYTCCGLASFRARDGSFTTYDRDFLKRVYKVTTKATPGSPAITTTTAYAVTADSGLAATVQRGGVFVSETTRSLDGLTTTTVSASRESTDSGDRLITRTRPAAGAATTAIEEYSVGADPATATVWTTTSQTTHYRDGSPHAVTGAAVTDATYTHAANTAVGGLVASTSTPTSQSTVETTETHTDALGRTVKTVTPANGTTTYGYYPTNGGAGSRGKLASVTDADGVAFSYTYNAKGEGITATRKVPNGTATPGNLVTTTTDEVVGSISIHDISLGVSRHLKQETGDGTTAITLSDSYTSADGLSSGTVTPTGSTVTYRTGPSSATVTTIHPDGTKTIQTTTPATTGDSTRTARFAVGADTPISSLTYLYDDLQRLLSVTDSRTGATTYSIFTESGTPLVTTQGGRATADTRDALGRVIQSVLPDNDPPTHPSVTHTSYYPTGRVKAQWGSQTYPTFRVYNEQGQLTGLHTWQTAPTLSQAIDTPPAASAVTSWIYDPATGRLSNKLDNDGVGPAYTYTAAGSLSSRTWTRCLITTYTYTCGFPTATNHFGTAALWQTYLSLRAAWQAAPAGDAKAAAKAAMDAAYAANAAAVDTTTPDIAIAYDFIGRQQSVSNGLAQSVFGYADQTGGDHGIATETITYSIPGQTPFTRVLARNARSLGRDTGWQLQKITTSPPATTIENRADYGYNPDTGLLETVTNTDNTFTYGYQYDQASVAAPRTGSVTGAKQDIMPYTVTRSDYPAIQAIRTYEGTRDALASIENRTGGGRVSKYDYIVNEIGQRTQVATGGSAFNAKPAAWTWHYDDLGQLKQAADTSTFHSNDRAYQYDTIGNRIRTANDTLTLPANPNYTANPINQYSAIGSLSPVYDLDGNATAYPLPAYPSANGSLAWDGENRQVSATANGVTTSYLYDALSRRIAKIPTTGPSTLYVYDGFNRIAEYSATTLATNLATTCLWGLDLSGTLQGAGGAGGLLAVKKQGEGYFYPTCDGNGNVSEYINDDETAVAHFEYDPFGNDITPAASAGYLHDAFAYRFSTKPLDSETGLYSYIYRPYDPLTGRWPSRDPIEEEGGENLYGFVRNDGIDTWDLLGDLPAGVDERPSLEELLENYPGFDDIKNTPKSVWDRAGGNCKGLNDDNLKDPKSKGKDLDSCTMRMSLAFNGTQRDQIKKINGIRQILDGNRNRSIVAVRELESYLKSQWGNPDFDINDKSKDIGDWSGRIADTCAIVLYVKSDGRRFHVGFASHGKPTRDHTPSLRNVRAVVWRIPCQKTSICCCINSDWIDITSEGWDNRNAR